MRYYWLFLWKCISLKNVYGILVKFLSTYIAEKGYNRLHEAKVNAFTLLYRHKITQIHAYTDVHICTKKTAPTLTVNDESHPRGAHNCSDCWPLTHNTATSCTLPNGRGIVEIVQNPRRSRKEIVALGSLTGKLAGTRHLLPFEALFIKHMDN